MTYFWAGGSLLRSKFALLGTAQLSPIHHHTLAQMLLKLTGIYKSSGVYTVPETIYSRKHCVIHNEMYGSSFNLFDIVRGDS